MKNEAKIINKWFRDVPAKFRFQLLSQIFRVWSFEPKQRLEINSRLLIFLGFSIIISKNSFESIINFEITFYLWKLKPLR